MTYRKVSQYGLAIFINTGLGPTAVDDPGTVTLPAGFALSQNYPNPFNPITRIEYTVGRASNVKLEIFNILGELVRTLVSQARRPGKYEVQWNGVDDGGHSVASGMYFYRLTVGDEVQAKKMILLK